MTNQPNKRAQGQSIEQASERPTVRPAVDIYENRDEILLVADMPGVSVDNLRLEVDAGRITLSGTAMVEPGDEALAREFTSLDYRRTFELTTPIQRDKVSAELKQGVLRVHLPKAEAIKPRQISVRAG